MALSRLPPEVEEAIRPFCTRLKAAAGEDLHSVVVYGSAARGDWTPNRSDVNVLIVMSAVHREMLDSIAPVVREAQASVLLHPMVTTQEELDGAADAYPVLFFDLRRHHVLVHGKQISLPTVAESHLRLRVEQQIRDFVMRLRTTFLKDRDHPKRLALELESASSGFLAVLEALVYLETKEWPADRCDAARRAAELIGADPAALTGLTETQPRTEAIYLVYEDLMQHASRLSLFVDGMELW